MASRRRGRIFCRGLCQAPKGLWHHSLVYGVVHGCQFNLRLSGLLFDAQDLACVISHFVTTACTYEKYGHPSFFLALIGFQVHMSQPRGNLDFVQVAFVVVTQF